MIRSLRASPWVVALALLGCAAGPGAGTAVADPASGPWVVQTRTSADAAAVARDVGAAPDDTFPTLGGFTARLTPAQLGAVGRHPGVVGVEPDRAVVPREPRPVPPSRVRAAAPQQNWGLDRIDQRALPLDGRPTTAAGATGAGVTIYVLDTGVDTTHPEFGGRARTAVDVIGDAPDRTAGDGGVRSAAAGGPAGRAGGDGPAVEAFESSGDCDGHGTVVAGIAASQTYGVAPEAQVRSVRVLDCDGVATLSSLLAGIDWVARNAQRPAVAVTSWSYGESPVLAAAVRGLVDGGVFVAASAGNSGADDCAALPRAVPGVLVVASSTRDDRRAATSSTGPCVDVYAPGVSVVSTTPGGGAESWSGTSMAAPHAAGVAALYKQVHGDAPSAVVERWIVDHATPGVVRGGAVGGTPNRLLHAGGL